jgi:dihydrodipicolinate synthase/N-acetylneuraminate lyase
MGYWGTLVASECGTTFKEYAQFMEIAAAAAPKGFALVTHLSFDTIDQMINAAHTAETLGFEGALVSYPPTFRPKSAAEIVAFTKHLADATDLALILFGVGTWGFRSLHASQFPPDALEQMARFPTAAAIKYEANAPGMITGIADIPRRCGKNGDRGMPARAICARPRGLVRHAVDGHQRLRFIRRSGADLVPDAA